MSTVKVKVTKDGEVITQNKKNPKFGYFLVETGGSRVISFTENFGNINYTRQALVTVAWSVLEEFASTGLALVENGPLVVLDEGVELPGKIVVHESVNQADLFDITKVDENHGKKYRSGAHREADIPYCDENGQVIYQKKFYTADPTIQDKLVATGNRDEVDAFTEEQLAKKNTKLIAGFGVKTTATAPKRGAGVKA